MIVGDIQELGIVAVLDRGIPNKECIAIQANETINMGRFGLMLGRFTDFKLALPYFDHLFWFGDGNVHAKDWLFVYTGSGNFSKRRKDDLYDVHSLYWGKPTTVFADSFVVPMLFRVDAVDIQSPAINVPQLGKPES